MKLRNGEPTDKSGAKDEEGEEDTTPNAEGEEAEEAEAEGKEFWCTVLSVWRKNVLEASSVEDDEEGGTATEVCVVGAKGDEASVIWSSVVIAVASVLAQLGTVRGSLEDVWNLI